MAKFLTLEGLTYFWSKVKGKLDNKVDKVTGKGLSTNDLTATLKEHYDVAYTHAQSSHAPTGAQANVIESIKVDGTALTVTNKSVNINSSAIVTAITNTEIDTMLNAN